MRSFLNQPTLKGFGCRYRYLIKLWIWVVGLRHVRNVSCDFVCAFSSIIYVHCIRVIIIICINLHLKGNKSTFKFSEELESVPQVICQSCDIANYILTQTYTCTDIEIHQRTSLNTHAHIHRHSHSNTHTHAQIGARARTSTCTPNSHTHTDTDAHIHTRERTHPNTRARFLHLKNYTCIICMFYKSMCELYFPLFSNFKQKTTQFLRNIQIRYLTKICLQVKGRYKKGSNPISII